MSAMEMRTVHILQMMQFITTRVIAAMPNDVRSIRVDTVPVEPTPEFPNRVGFQVEYTGLATVQAVMDCVNSAGNIGYVIKARWWRDEIGKQ